MKKEIFAALLMLLLIAGAALNVRHMDKLTGQVGACLERSEAAAQRGDFDAALNALEAGISLWEKEHSYTNIFIRHPELDDTYDTFYELKEIILQKDSEAFPAAFQKVQYHLDCINFMERPTIGSIF